jgi:aminoglycoside 3-N-acetyltransferase
MQSLINDLKNLGIQTGDKLLVHASFRSLGKVDGGPETVISALMESIGENGTLLMPALSYESVTESQPVFNVNETPSCVGALTEYFRQRAGTLRSLHPTHSISAYGKRAEFFVNNHEQDSTPVGLNSPLSKLKDEHGKILFIGCGLKPNTSMHGIEEFVIPEYLYNGDVAFTIEDTDGKTKQYNHTTHGFDGWEQRYDRIENILNDRELKKGKVLEADCYLMDAVALWAKAFKKLKGNPLYFIDKN